MATAKKPGISFYAVMFVVVFLSTIAHEIVHLLTAMACGAKTFAFSLGRVSYLAPVDEGDFTAQRTLIALSGPVFTLALGLFGAWLAIARRMAFGYSLVFVAFFFRLVAMAMSVFAGNHNDEARVSLDLGFPYWALPSVFVITLGAAFIASSVRLRFGFLVLILSYLTVSAAFTGLIYHDGQLPGQDRCDGILSPFFAPEFGC